MSTTEFKGDSPPIRKEADLCQMFLNGEKPRQRWGVGTEHEKLGFLFDGSPLLYHGKKGQAGITTVLEKFAQLPGWKTVEEAGNLIALKGPRGEAITLEPGGQLELSGSVLPDVHHTCSELGAHLKHVQTLSQKIGVCWMTAGCSPFAAREVFPWVPKQRYQLMRQYLSTRGSLALDMMQYTCTIQVNLDYADEADMGRKLRLLFLLSPLATALFAASPFMDGKPCGCLSQRALIWEKVDSHRCGFIPGALMPQFGYADYVQYALDVPMFFIQRDGRHLDCSGLSFRTFLEYGFHGEQALEEDWTMHLTTLFPHARLKQFIEWRPADMGPPSMVCALAALARGLLYEARALSEVEALATEWPVKEIVELQSQAAIKGLEALLLKRSLRCWGRELLEIASGGLQRLGRKDPQGEDEVRHLNPLWEVVEGLTQAERMLDLWQGAWKKDISGIFESDFVLSDQEESHQAIANLG